MIIKVKVKTNSSNSEIKVMDDFYLVSLKSLPIEGRANLELLKILKKYFKAKDIKIKSGFNSKIKLIEVL